MLPNVTQRVHIGALPPPDYAAGQEHDPDAAESESGSESEVVRGDMTPQIASGSEGDHNPYQAEQEDIFRDAARVEHRKAEELRRSGQTVTQTLPETGSVSVETPKEQIQEMIQEAIHKLTGQSHSLNISPRYIAQGGST